jgi:hypothetical protein
MKERRVRCKQCGERFTILRFERERTSAYCDLCREERKREQARERMRTMRARLTKHIHRCLPPISQQVWLRLDPERVPALNAGSDVKGGAPQALTTEANQWTASTSAAPS